MIDIRIALGVTSRLGLLPNLVSLKEWLIRGMTGKLALALTLALMYVFSLSSVPAPLDSPLRSLTKHSDLSNLYVS